MNRADPTRPLATIATYNERENLPGLIEEIRRHLPDCDVLVVDDNSPDGTGRWAMEQSAADPTIQVLNRPGKLGLGTATVAAMQYAVERRYSLLLNLDADFSHPPRYIPDILARMQSTELPPVDVVVGSRYVPGGKTEGWPLQRKILSRSVNCAARWGLSLPLRDCSGAFRCYRVSKLAELDLSQARSKGYAFQEEILWMILRAGGRFAEVPITFVERELGKSKVNWSEALVSLHALGSMTARNWLGRS